MYNYYYKYSMCTAVSGVLIFNNHQPGKNIIKYFVHDVRSELHKYLE